MRCIDRQAYRAFPFLLLLCLAAQGQQLTKEYIRLGGRVIAVEYAGGQLSAGTIVPGSGSGARQIFTADVTDTTGYASIDRVQIVVQAGVPVVTPSSSRANGCSATYDRSENRFYLVNDSATALITPALIPGDATQTAQNSQCILHAIGSSASGNGNVLSVHADMEFLPSFAGPKGLYLFGRNTTAETGYKSVGSWTVPSSTILNPSSANLGPAAQQASVQVTNSGSWSAASNNPDWITLSGSNPRTGNQQVTYSVTAHTGSAGRTGSITIAGQAFTIVQQPPATSAVASPTTFLTAGGTGTLTITSNTAWTAASNATWLTIGGSSSQTGTGNQTLAISVAASTPGQPRTGTISVAGTNISISQQAIQVQNVSFGTMPPASVGRIAGSGTTIVNCTSGDRFTIVATGINVSPTSGPCGSGISYSYTENSQTITKTMRVQATAGYQGSLSAAFQIVQAGSTFSISAPGFNSSPIALRQGATVSFNAFFNGVEMSDSEVTWTADYGQWQGNRHTVALQFPSAGQPTYWISATHKATGSPSNQIEIIENTAPAYGLTTELRVPNPAQVDLERYYIYQVDAIDPLGNADRIKDVELKFSNGTSSCTVWYQRSPTSPGGHLFGINGSVRGQVGSETILEGNGCKLRMGYPLATTSVYLSAPSGTRRIFFEVAVASELLLGNLEVQAKATASDSVSSTSSIVALNVRSVNRPPVRSLISATAPPGAANGALQPFVFAFTDPDSNLKTAEVRFGGENCWFTYDSQSKTLSLLHATGLFEAQLGLSTHDLGNSKCRIDTGLSSYTNVTNGVHLNLRMQFNTGFSGTQLFDGRATDSENRSQGFDPALGTWVVPAGARVQDPEFRVRQMYLDFLLREPESAGTLDFWKAVATPSMVVSLYDAAEFQNGIGFIARAYRAILGRDIDAGSARFQRIRGTQNPFQFIGELISSDEFQNKYPAAVPINADGNAEFIRVLYRNALLRNPSESEVAGHVSTFSTREQKASEFMATDEFKNLHKNRMFAALLYAILLRRDGGPGEAEWWATQIQNGMSREAVAGSFLGSGEYSSRFP